jgi:hypothetical protein
MSKRSNKKLIHQYVFLLYHVYPPPFNQLLNILVMFVGGGISYVKKSMRQIIWT